MDHNKIKDLIEAGLTNESFDECVEEIRVNVDIQWEAKSTDENGNLVVGKVLTDDHFTIDWRGTQENPEILFAKNCVRENWIIAVTDLY